MQPIRMLKKSFFVHTNCCIILSLFPLSVDNLGSQEVLDKLEEGQVDGTLAPQIESACVLLSYLADALHAINTTQPHSESNYLYLHTYFQEIDLKTIKFSSLFIHCSFFS